MVTIQEGAPAVLEPLRGVAPKGLVSMLADSTTIRFPISGNHSVLIDREALSLIEGMPWYVFERRNGTRYVACKRFNDTVILMHRYIVGAADGQIVDHRDGDGLNNTLANLRICSSYQNSQNRRKSTANTSGFKGVCQIHNGRFRAVIRSKSRQTHLGYFNTPEDAARAYDAAARKEFGEFACLNFPVSDERGAL